MVVIGVAISSNFKHGMKSSQEDPVQKGESSCQVETEQGRPVRAL